MRFGFANHIKVISVFSFMKNAAHNTRCRRCNSLAFNVSYHRTLMVKYYLSFIYHNAIHSPSALSSVCPYPDLVLGGHFSFGPLLSSSCYLSLNCGNIILGCQA